MEATVDFLVLVLQGLCGAMIAWGAWLSLSPGQPAATAEHADRPQASRRPYRRRKPARGAGSMASQR